MVKAKKGAYEVDGEMMVVSEIKKELVEYRRFVIKKKSDNSLKMGVKQFKIMCGIKGEIECQS